VDFEVGPSLNRLTLFGIVIVMGPLCIYAFLTTSLPTVFTILFDIKLLLAFGFPTASTKLHFQFFISAAAIPKAAADV
jgi:hypothetical protein